MRLWDSRFHFSVPEPSLQSEGAPKGSTGQTHTAGLCLAAWGAAGPARGPRTQERGRRGPQTVPARAGCPAAP